MSLHILKFRLLGKKYAEVGADVIALLSKHRKYVPATEEELESWVVSSTNPVLSKALHELSLQVFVRPFQSFSDRYWEKAATDAHASIRRRKAWTWLSDSLAKMLYDWECSIASYSLRDAYHEVLRWQMNAETCLRLRIPRESSTFDFGNCLLRMTNLTSLRVGFVHAHLFLDHDLSNPYTYSYLKLSMAHFTLSLTDDCSTLKLLLRIISEFKIPIKNLTLQNIPDVISIALRLKRWTSGHVWLVSNRYGSIFRTSISVRNDETSRSREILSKTEVCVLSVVASPIW